MREENKRGKKSAGNALTTITGLILKVFHLDTWDHFEGQNFREEFDWSLHRPTF